MQTVWILGDQLVEKHGGLERVKNKKDVCVLLIESAKRGTHLRYHQQKLVLIYAAMRHYAEELRGHGWTVDYREAETFEGGLKAHLDEHKSERVVVMEPNDYATTQAIPKVAEKLKIGIEFIPTTQFLLSREKFKKWAGSKKSLLMETHYRRMRKDLNILVNDDGNPEGGEWNFDSNNRQTFKAYDRQGVSPPRVPAHQHDKITQAVIKRVSKEFADHPGQASAFWLPVTRKGAKEWLKNFVENRLEGFGPWEDTMVAGETTLFHSLLSPLLNIGLLSPQQCVDAAVKAYRDGRAPINSVEGFIRQIIGWREFINGIYWLKMPGYTELNELEARRALPKWVYTGETDLACVSACLNQVIDTGYNHHIQRLMVLGNFFLLGGYNPQQVLQWYSEMYVDAYEWVMAANVIGMILYADGGFMATKPYAAGSGYINKMSNYCQNCRYKVSSKTGDEACPFNYLYWNFYEEHADRFESNHRVSMMLSTLRKKSKDERKAIRASAAKFLERQM